MNQVTLADLGDTGLGDITVSEGTLQFEAGSTMGNSANSVTVASGATLGFENSTVIHNKVTFLNGGILDNKRSWDLAAVPPAAMPLTYGAADHLDHAGRRHDEHHPQYPMPPRTRRSSSPASCRVRAI